MAVRVRKLQWLRSNRAPFYGLYRFNPEGPFDAKNDDGDVKTFGSSGDGDDAYPLPSCAGRPGACTSSPCCTGH